MPRPFEIEKYPPQFLELIQLFEGNPSEPITIMINHEGQVKPKALQLELQAFRGALRKLGEITKYPNFNDAEICVSLDGNSIFIARKDTTPHAKVVQKTLDLLHRKE